MDKIDQRVREIALGMAVQATAAQPSHHTDVVRAAEAFYAFLKPAAKESTNG